MTEKGGGGRKEMSERGWQSILSSGMGSTKALRWKECGECRALKNTNGATGWKAGGTVA